MKNSVNLKLDWCSYNAAKYACEHWHYSRCMPCAKTVKIGIWENDVFIGVIIFSLGAGNMCRGDKYGLSKTHEVCELSRVALKKHYYPVSKMLSIAIKMLKQQSPGIKLVISFSDFLGQNHIGAIYQACNFVYTGSFTGDGGFIVNGKQMHNRSVYSKGWKQNLDWIKNNIDPNAKKNPTIKHRYLYPLTKEIRKQIELLAKPYPKRPVSIDNDAPGFQSGEGGVSPTTGLHINNGKVNG